MILNGFMKTILMHLGGMLPLLIVLDFGMGIQLRRDYSFIVVLLFMSALVFYASVVSKSPIYKD